MMEPIGLIFKILKMKRIIFIVLLLCSFKLWSQNPVNPVCDEALEIPYGFNYSGFVFFEENTMIVQSSFRMQVVISENSTDGPEVYTQNFSVPFSKKGYFNLEIGKFNEEQFMEFLLHLNENTDKDYFINVYFRNADFQNVLIGSKPIQTVPYAFVANSINGIGPRGEPGMVMRSSPPNSNSVRLYVDDGTNTADGMPHLRHKVAGTNTWIDL